MDLQIRPAEIDDAAFIAPLVNSADGGLPFHIWTTLARPDADPWEIGVRRVQADDTPISWRMAWIAEQGGRPVGAVIVHQLSESAEELQATLMSPLWVPFVELEIEAADTAYIRTISVVEDCRSSGVGAKLLRFAERFRGPEGTSLIVADHDTASLRFFERHGYREAARRTMVKDGWAAPGTDWILMRKA